MSLMDSTCSASCLATLLDLSESRVHQLARLGIIQKVGRGEYALWASVARYVVYLRAQAPCRKHPPQRLVPGSTSLVQLLRQMAAIIRSH